MNNSEIPQYRGAEQAVPAQRSGEPEPGRFTRLKAVTVWVFALHLVGSAWGLILIGSGATTEATMRMLRETPGAEMLSEEQVRLQVQMSEWIAIGTGVFGLVLAVAVFLLVYLGLRRRANWARIVGIVMAFVSLGMGIFQIVSLVTESAFLGALGIVGPLLNLLSYAALIYWLVLAFHREVREFLVPRRMA
ncbi:hypothetical protein NBM05_14990 [Rothia sp. AR01]|uniref:DUF2569 domain-containing protein n=1 Tax=Rothia santali TaxID=2949643 RepID=A0A9X2HK95_9MICC|nr:hypothetical protein [Rothia santali]MCP3427276.1 hypothetical protein [Rothia santali]